jgi:tetratricopeptide (TPR) repeat protein/transcriptional regulator with XRE-family HTH domain
VGGTAYCLTQDRFRRVLVAVGGSGCEGMLGAVEQPGLRFAGLLRQLRVEARLTQEELADAAGLSPRSVSDLERGVNRTAHKDTAMLLAGALGLDGRARELFVAAARGKVPAADVLAAWQGGAAGAFAAAATRGLPRDLAAFTGREGELARLAGAVDGLSANGGVVGIHAIDGMAGIGKTTLAVHAAHRLAGGFPDGQFFLPLHAHTAGQRPVDPADALASLLLSAGVGAAQIPPGLEARSVRWRDFVAGRKILLVLDDAAGHEQVRPLLPGTPGSLGLVTSRRRLAALEDAVVISLDTLPRDEAAQLLARLAARTVMRAADPVVGEITRLCGYLPLAIGMIASQLRHHPAWTAAGLVAQLAAARDRLSVMRAENLSVAAAFDLSYQDLTDGGQRFFRRLGLVPGPTGDAYAAAALDGTTLDTARRYLDELYDQHLITEPAPGRYLLHDLLREHARALADGDDAAESAAAAGRLLDYYLHIAVAAGRHIPAWTATQGRPPPSRPPAYAPDLPTLAQAAAWLEAERPNLHAATDYAAASGRTLHAVQIPAAVGDFLRAHGDWAQAAALHRAALAAARQAGDRPGQALAHRQLGILAWLSGDFPAAAFDLTRAVALYGETGDRPGQSYALDHLGVVQQMTGDYPAALSSRQQALAVARGCGDRLAEAMALGHLSWIQQLTGDYSAAGPNVMQVLEIFRSLGHRLGEADVLGGVAEQQREAGDYPAAAASLQRGLELFVELGHRPFVAGRLNELGDAQQLTGDYAAAAANHRRALDLHCEIGFRIGEAETLNSLGELSTRTAATGQARGYHTQALTLARDIGLPLQEARALEGIGRSHLQDGNPGQANAHLRHALVIYQRIGSARARRVQETLRQPEPQPASQPRPVRHSKICHQR